MAVGAEATFRVIDSRQSQSECGKEKYITPLHLSCGACACCSDNCGDASCVHCDSKPSSMDSRSTSACGGVSSLRYYTMCEIRRHNTEKSAWLVVGEDIYDATNYINQHPGGKASILKKSGGACDCSEDFLFHSKSGRRVWKRYLVGRVKSCPILRSDCPIDRHWWKFWL